MRIELPHCILFEYKNETFEDQQYGELGKHRGRNIWASVSFFKVDDVLKRLAISGIEVLIIRLGPREWVIGPRAYDDDDRMEDLGPFDTLEDALIYMKLVDGRYF